MRLEYFEHQPADTMYRQTAAAGYAQQGHYAPAEYWSQIAMPGSLTQDPNVIQQPMTTWHGTTGVEQVQNPSVSAPTSQTSSVVSEAWTVYNHHNLYSPLTSPSGHHATSPTLPFTGQENYMGAHPGFPTHDNVAQAMYRSPSGYEWMRTPTYRYNPHTGKTRTKDKYRVVYSDHQRLELEKEFRYSRYITIRRKAEIAVALGLSDRQVKIWFQNRRAKERKQSKKTMQQQQEKCGKNHVEKQHQESHDINHVIKEEKSPSGDSAVKREVQQLAADPPSVIKSEPNSHPVHQSVSCTLPSSAHCLANSMGNYIVPVGLKQEAVLTTERLAPISGLNASTTHLLATYPTSVTSYAKNRNSLNSRRN